MRKLLREREVDRHSLTRKGVYILSALMLGFALPLKAEESHLDFYSHGETDPVVYKTSVLKSIVFGSDGKLQLNSPAQDNFATVDPMTLTHIAFSTAPIKENGIASVDEKVTVSVTPNPASESFRVIGVKDCDVVLYSIAGSKMLTVKNYKGENISISHLPKGIYIVKADKYTTKLIKK